MLFILAKGLYEVEIEVASEQLESSATHLECACCETLERAGCTLAGRVDLGGLKQVRW